VDPSHPDMHCVGVWYRGMNKDKESHPHHTEIITHIENQSAPAFYTMWESEMEAKSRPEHEDALEQAERQWGW